MLWTELFTTDIGLLSLFTIAFIVGMAVFFIAYIKRHVAEDTRDTLAGRHAPLMH